MTKTPSKTPTRTPSHGNGKLRVGNAGNRGGRPPNEFKARMRALASSDLALDYLTECVAGKHGPQAALRAQEFVTERGYGKVPQALDAKLDHRVLVVRDVRILEASERADTDD